MKKIFILLFFSLLSCHGNDDKNCCMNIESDILITLVNSEGLDLLDPSSNGAIDSSNIQVRYEMENGEKKLINDPNFDASKGFHIIDPEETQTDKYSLQLFLNTDYLDEENISYTYIEWSSADIDEIKSQFIRENNNLLVSKVWVNGELSWERINPKIVLILK